ncbi:MAG: O-antigen ligase family protein [Phycisphaerae bacterium]|nr:O-antigen ligase family protein [Phycisphaerae bacterium]
MPLDSSSSKTKGQVILEYVLLALCLCVIALRATDTENPAAQSASFTTLSDNLYTLSVSAVLFFSFVLWFIFALCSSRFSYRFTALEIGLCLLCIAAVIAGFAASNKRAAITDSLCLIAPVLMAVLLVQILDSPSKIKLVLTVIAALGVVSAHQCVEQFFVSNKAVIAQYEQNPQTMLQTFGIQPGSFQQFLFEHRLYSKDVRAFFTTGNSAGSFAILACFAALALFIDKFKNRRTGQYTLVSLITSGIVVSVVIFGLIITRSKGAIAASLIAAAMFVAFIYLGNWLNSHKKAILFVCLIFFIAAVFAISAYGLAHDRLPGGNSMLVRWQYWHASAKMYADHWRTGVGPGNFAHFYTHYKPAAAIESVSDPHNFLLSVLTQYGPLGLIGFLALFILPLWKSFPVVSLSNPPGKQDSPRQLQPQPNFRTLAITYLTIVSAALLFIRPMIMPSNYGDTPNVIIYVVFTLYVTPVIAFILGSWFLTTGTKQAASNGSRATYITAALFCAAIGLLLHNLIDFAIFEPPVFTAFCAIIACLIAADFKQKAFALKPALPAKIILTSAALALIAAYLFYAWAPVAKTTKIQRQMHRFGYSYELLDKAIEYDRMDPIAPNLNGRLYLQRYKETPNAQTLLLEKAKTCFLAAIDRDKADFRNYEKLSDVYALLAKNPSSQEKKYLLNKSLDYLNSTVERYPGSSDLRIELAEVAEQLAKNDVAMAQYEKAVEIEDAYRSQFKIMYPGRNVFSRLSQEKYDTAKQRINALSEQPTP